MGTVVSRAALAVPLLFGLAACGGSGDHSTPPSLPAIQRPAAAPLALAVTPAANAQQVQISAEIGTQVTGGKVTDVALTEAGAPVPGRLRDDGTSWVPDRPLKYRQRYAATVTATAAGGKTATTKTTFTTMPAPGGGTVGTGLYLFDGVTYGVAMPVVVEFDADIPPAARAGIERRMFVSTDPPQPGAWAWFGDRQAYYRGARYWQPGTRLAVRIALEGHPMGGNRYGDIDRRATGRIAPTKTVIDIDNATKQMTVYQDGTLVKTMPVSLGKASTPSSTGTMVVMDKQASMTFDTRRDPNPGDRYVVNVSYAQRLTWGGEFIHAAPWSVADQGVRNVSHGCVNLSWSNAEWLFSTTRVGDPVTVKGTERRVDPGNGWTAWDLSWADYVARSALPHPEIAAATGYTTKPSIT